jgi:hypothetical protein
MTSAHSSAAHGKSDYLERCDRIAQGRVVRSAKTSRHGVIAPLIVEKEARPSGGDVVESPGNLSLTKGR